MKTKALTFMLALVMVLPLCLSGCKSLGNDGNGEATRPAGTESGTTEPPAATAKNLNIDEFLCKTNEKLLFMFKTENGNIVSVCIGENDGYIVCRYGTAEKLEFEYPEDKTNSWDKFTYSYYLRGGGVQNEAMDLNSLKFSYNNNLYEIFDNYYAADETPALGIIINGTEEKGIADSKSGSLFELRNNGKIKIIND